MLLGWRKGCKERAFDQLPAFVHWAARGADNARHANAYADDGGDLCYVKNCAKAIALLQTAPKLNHTVYNVGDGWKYTNAQVVASIRRCAPHFDARLTPGSSVPEAPVDAFMDIERLRRDTGYTPDFGFDEGIADYIAWLQAGHDA